VSSDTRDAERRSGSDRRKDAVHLSPREREVLKLVLEGLQNKEIARRLGIGEQATKEHVSALLRKFDVPNRAALADAGARREMIGAEGPVLDRTLFPQLFRSAKLMIAITSGPDHRYVVVNDAFARSIHRDVVGMTMREAFPETELGNFELADRVYATGEAFTGHEIPATADRGKGPELTYTDGIVQALRGEDDKTEGIIFFGIDVTEQVRTRTRATESSDGRA
jgi:DNA-binding CsgD family transcriptional regulator